MHTHTKITIGSNFLVGSYIYKYNEPLVIEFDILGKSIEIDGKTEKLYDSVYNVTTISYLVSFDNAAIDGTL